VETLWRKVVRFFEALWIDTWTTLSRQISGILDGIMGWFRESFGKHWDDSLEAFIEEAAGLLGMEKEQLDPLKKVVKWPYPLDSLASVLLLLIVYAGWTKSIVDKYMQLSEMEVNEEIRPTLLDPQTLAAAAYKRPDLAEVIEGYLNKLGLDDTQKSLLIYAMQNFISVSSLWALVNRGEMEEADAIQQLVQQGYSEDDATKLMSLRHYIPSPSELVTLAGRDQFEPETIEKFHLWDGLPQELVDWAKKIGMSEYWIKRFWGAHWTVPSINQAFEMLHRGVITEDELDVFYDLADIAPYFREKLKQIAYMPYTRVDVRRMHELGVLSDEDLKRAYMDLGYDEEHAENMVEFTKRYNAQTGRELTLSQLRKLYEYGKMDASTFESYLRSLDYDEDEAKWIRILVDTERAFEETEEQIKLIQEKYIRGEYTPAEVYAEMGKLGIKATTVSRYLTLWHSARERMIRRPTKADLIRWRKKHYIDDETFKRKMRELRYRDEDIERYLKEIKEAEGGEEGGEGPEGAGGRPSGII